ncbi:MAG: Chaperone SurA [Desulfovibrio sp.]
MTGNGMRMRKSILLASMVLLLLTGCQDNIWHGEVASVNGRPITIDQVAAARNSTYFDWTSSPMADVDEMRKQYGDALTNLVVVELVKQQLEKKKLAVTAEDVAAEEKLIRADYPPGTFEDTLVSEAIDLEMWRFLLRNYLSVQRFLDTILRDEVVISPEEVEAYLQVNPRDFVLPPWAYFFLVSGADGAEVAACAKDLDTLGDPVKAQEKHPATAIRTVTMDTPHLPPTLAEEIQKLSAGDLSGVFTFNGEYHQILLLQFLPERQAEPQQAYRQIEKTLFAQKMHTEYNAWVLKRLKKASIKVSKQLLPHLKRQEAGNSAAQ